MINKVEIPLEFEGWYFEHGYFCTPEGDRFSPLILRACFFYKQLQGVRDLLYWRPVKREDDLIMAASTLRLDERTELDVLPGKQLDPTVDQVRLSMHLEKDSDLSVSAPAVNPRCTN